MSATFSCAASCVDTRTVTLEQWRTVLRGETGHKIQLLPPGEQSTLESQGEFSEPFLPVGKPGTSLGENRDHNPGVLLRDVG